MSRKTERLYQILELPNGASAEEVKKAYFRLIRKYSPEKEPEKFQELRKAYEALRNGPPKEEEERDTSWMHWDTPLVGFLLEQADAQADREQYDQAAKTMEDALLIEPKNALLHLVLARYQMYGGHPQKAAKSAEFVTKTHPECREAWMLLANGTHNRGWYKKALPAFRKAYELGERNFHFLVGFGNNLNQNGASEEAATRYREALADYDWKAEEPQQVVWDFRSITQELPEDRKLAEEILDRFDAFTSASRKALKGAEMDLLFILGPMMDGLLMSDIAFFRRIMLSLNRLGLHGIMDEKHLEALRKLLIGKSLDWNPLDLSIAWRQMAMAMIDADRDPEMSHFLQRDAELCMLHDPDRILREVQTVRREYPPLFAFCEDFLKELEQGNREMLYRRAKRGFDRKFGEYGFLSKYRTLCPEDLPENLQDDQPARKKKRKSGMEWAEPREDDGDEAMKGWFPEAEEPFVREQEKVGRNDPCPCGSGKKFKKCCMGKGIYD